MVVPEQLEGRSLKTHGLDQSIFMRPDLKPIENLWQDLKIAAHRRSPSNLTEREIFCNEECAKNDALDQGSSNYGPPVVQELQFPPCLVMSVNVRVLQCLM